MRLALAALLASVVAVGFAGQAAGLGDEQTIARCFVALRNDSTSTVRLNQYDTVVGWPGWPPQPAWAFVHWLAPSTDDVHPRAISPIFASISQASFSPPPCSLNVRWDSLDRRGSVSCRIDDDKDKPKVDCTVGDQGSGIHLAVRTENVRVEESDHPPYLWRSYGGTVVVTDLRSGGFGAPSPPKPVPPVLGRGDLHGRGWHKPTGGQTRALLGWLTPTRALSGCASARQTPYDASGAGPVGWLFVRDHGGQELIAGSAETFARAAQARRAQAALLSAQTARCLALSISTHKGLTASAQRLKFGKVGDRSAAFRIRIRSSARRGKASYLDLVSLHKGRGMAMIGFYAEGHQLASEIEQAAASTVARRMKR